MRRKRDAGIAIARARTTFDHRLVQADRIEQLVEDAHEVVLRVVERLGRNRPRVAQHVPGLLDHETQRVAQHFRQVVAHQQRFVFVDGQPGVALARRERQADAPLLHAVLGDELADTDRRCPAAGSSG